MSKGALKKAFSTVGLVAGGTMVGVGILAMGFAGYAFMYGAASTDVSGLEAGMSYIFGGVAGTVGAASAFAGAWLLRPHLRR